MSYTVRLLDPAIRFLEGLRPTMQAKAYRAVNLLENVGPLLGPPYAKSVVSQRGLRELRVQLGSEACRLFYFHFRNVVYVVTSGYMKKAQKLDVLEIQRAARLMRTYMEENR